MRHSLISIALLALVACTPTESTTPAASAQSATLTTDQDKTLYAIGLAIGQNVRDFKLTESEVDLVVLGLKDSVLGVEPKAELEVYGPRIQVMMQERMQAVAAAERQASDAWVAEQAALPGAQRSATGVVVIPITEGTGANP